MNNAVGGSFEVRGQTVETVLGLVESWSRDTNGHRFRYLLVRSCIKSGVTGEGVRVIMIEFLYVLPGEKDFKTEQNDFFQKHRRQLRDSFGFRKVRWSLSTPVTVVRLPT